MRAIDPFDNVDLTPAVHTWTVVAAPPGPDAIAPSTTISSAPTDPSTSTTATFEFRGSDNSTPGPSLTFECSLDGAAFVACTSPATYPGLGLGEHTFEVRAIDLQGNTDATPATHTWTIVGAAGRRDRRPTRRSTPARISTTVSTDATFTFSSERGRRRRSSARSTASAFAPCTSPAVYGGLAVGDHTFAVRAVDAAGNPDPTPATYAVDGRAAAGRARS